MNTKVIDDDFLAMMLGGTKDSEGIKVTGSVPNQSFTAEGTFRVTSETGDSLKRIKFYNLKAQVSADLTLSASEVSSFSLVLDILSDANNKILDITDVAGTSGVSEPEVISFMQDEE